MEDKFYLFRSQTSHILLKIYDDASEKDRLFYKREVELFKDLNGLKFESPELILTEYSEEDNQLYILNNS